MITKDTCKYGLSVVGKPWRDLEIRVCSGSHHHFMVQHTYLPNFLFFKKKFLAALCLRSWVQAFSSWGDPGLLSGCGTWASHCSGFSCCEYRLWVSRWLSGKESTCNAGDSGDAGSVPGLGRSPGEGNGTPLQYSCLGNPMDRGAWRATVHGVTKMLDTIELKSD